MKVNQLIAVIIIICLQTTLAMAIQTTSSVEALNNINRSLTSTETKNIGKCGSQLIMSYFALPKKPKPAKYKSRWPKPLPLPHKKKRIPPHPTFVDYSQGMLAFSKLSDKFPASKIAKKKKKNAKHGSHKKGHKAHKGGKGHKGSHGSSHSFSRRTITTVKMKVTGTLDKWPAIFFSHVKVFMGKYDKENPSSEKPKSSVAKAPAAKTQKGKNAAKKNEKKLKKLKKKPLTAQQYAALKAAHLQADINKRERRKCFNKIFKYLQQNFKYKLKGKKCVALGRICKRCFGYS
jgi:hypothetical protein